MFGGECMYMCIHLVGGGEGGGCGWYHMVISQVVRPAMHAKGLHLHRDKSGHPKWEAQVVAYRRGHLRELRPYWAKILSHQHMVAGRDIPHVLDVVSMSKVTFQKKKIWYLALRISVSCTTRDTIMLQKLIIQFPHYHLLSCLLREVKNKRKFPHVQF